MTITIDAAGQVAVAFKIEPGSLNAGFLELMIGGTLQDHGLNDCEICNTWFHKTKLRGVQLPDGSRLACPECRRKLNQEVHS